MMVDSRKWIISWKGKTAFKPPQKELSFEWKKKQHRAFEDLKDKLSSTMLKFIDFTKSFEIHIDTNAFIIGGVFK